MKKKIALGLIAAVVVVGGVASMSAWEAHVINVTAHIENALAVSPEEIEFGTVFPQEYLERAFDISLSSSFLMADRVDDVEYIIKQKPKCICNDEQFCELETYAPVDYATHACPEGYEEMLSLCPFLSKLPQDEEQNDVGEPSYYNKDTNSCSEVEPSLAHGKLTKAGNDTTDSWMVDLKVPPVAGYVGQDWPAGCPTVPTNDLDYGCDLWIEVTYISEPGEPDLCTSADVMLVLDRSGSIIGYETQLKDAAKAFVTALNPDGGVHMGQSSFALYGSLDLHLTNDQTAINGAIDGLSFGGTTNLYEGIMYANIELAGGDGHDRPDTGDPAYPDYMIIITDGNPNEPSGGDPYVLASDEATAAKAAGVTIYVVGVGSVDADYLETIASPGLYYPVADWDDLAAVLEQIASCD